MTFHSGDIVLANYKKFDGTVTLGLFYVLYSENDDIRDKLGNTPVRSNNYVCCKVSSNPAMIYSMGLKQSEIPELLHDSHLNFSKFHTLAESEIVRRTAIVSDDVKGRVTEMALPFFKAFLTQVSDGETNIEY